MKHIFLKTLICFFFLFTLSCGSGSKETQKKHISVDTWWPNAVTYQIFVQAFYDADGDGIGDIQGVIAKLDYLKNLGVEAILLMPMHPSPTYHKYDVADFQAIHPDYGTIEDFGSLVEKAHQQGLKVLMDMPLNQTSNKHKWFQEAQKGARNPYRDYYIWSADPAEWAKSPEKWHELTDKTGKKIEGQTEKYYGLLGAEMPSLNYDNALMRHEIIQVGRFWLTEMGVDGLRIEQANRSFPEGRLADAQAFWKEYRGQMKRIKPEAFIVSDVGTEGVMPFYEGLDGVFNVEGHNDLLETVKAGKDVKHLPTALKKMRDAYREVNPKFVEATFLGNRHENRVMSQFKGKPNKAKMAAALLLTLPGAPFILYGEEIGMLGETPEEYILEPFLWKSDGSDDGQTNWIAPVYSTDATVSPLDKQMGNKESLYNHYKQLINIRKSTKILAMGEVVDANLPNEGIFGFYRNFKGLEMLVIHNIGNGSINVPLIGKPGRFSEVYFTTTKQATLSNGSITLPAYSTVILR